MLGLCSNSHLGRLPPCGFSEMNLDRHMRSGASSCTRMWSQMCPACALGSLRTDSTNRYTDGVCQPCSSRFQRIGPPASRKVRESSLRESLSARGTTVVPTPCRRLSDAREDHHRARPAAQPAGALDYAGTTYGKQEFLNSSAAAGVRPDGIAVPVTSESITSARCRRVPCRYGRPC